MFRKKQTVSLVIAHWISKLRAKKFENEKSQAPATRKILQQKSNMMEKASQRASTLNITKICPELIFATGASTLR